MQQLVAAEGASISPAKAPDVGLLILLSRVVKCLWTPTHVQPATDDQVMYDH